jgi:sodium-dependent dicarboxylate transporter 2/3/5
MVGYLADYGMPISFLEWMKIGVPFVPVMSWVIGRYMYLRLKPKFTVKGVNPSQVVRAEVENMPEFGGQEAMRAVILVLLVLAWILIGEHAGLGGPTL